MITTPAPLAQVISPAHHRALIATETEELKEAYKAWAETYDKEVMSGGFKAPIRLPEVSMPYIRKTHAAKSALQPLRVFDAGCGTGMAMQVLRVLLSFEQIPCYAIGADLSAHMLNAAKAKNCYDRCFVHDLNLPLPADVSSLDVILACGVFLEGHCGPGALATLLQPLAKGGHAVISVRKSVFDAEARMYEKAVVDTGCVIADDLLCNYFGDMDAHFLIVRRD